MLSTIFGHLVIEANAKGTLVSAIVLFRHGARAPVAEIAEEHKYSFPNGLGELTAKGIEGNRRVGKFLEERYVKTGFLRAPLLPSQVYFRSRSNNRCLMTGTTVGSEMFSSHSKPGMSAVPIFSYEKGENILEYPRGCTVDMDRLKALCNRQPDPNIKWPMFEGFVFECMGLHKNSTILKNAKDFSQVEALYTQDKNGLRGPDWYEQNKKEITELYQKVFAFNVGAGDSKALQLKQGKLLHTIIDTFVKQRKEHEDNGSLSKRKFTAYSTQDWLLQSLLNGIGAVKDAIGETIPNFNSMIIFEMMVKDSKYGLQVFYRDGVSSTLKEITKSIRGCDSTPCPIEKFSACCDAYKTDDPNKVCGV